LVRYEFANSLLTITETKTDADYEFTFKVFEDGVIRRLKQVRAEVEGNTDLTDVHFATQPDNVYTATVRHDFRMEFLLLLFKYEIVDKLWYEL
jgi:hypothetical protein